MKLALELMVKAGRLIDGSGEPAEKHAVFGIENGVFQLIDFDGTPDASGADTLDLSDCTIIPGLIDSHVHLTMSGVNDPEIRQRQLIAGYAETRPAIERRLAALWSFGAVGVRDGGDHSGHVLKYKQETRSSPVEVAAAGKAWRAKNRYGKLIGRCPENGRSLKDGIESQSHGIDHVKIVQSGLNSLIEFGKETPPQFQPEELRAGVEAAHRLGLKTMIHANGRIPVRTAIEAGCDSIEHGFFMGFDNLERMAEKGVTWVPTAVTMKAYAETPADSRHKRDIARKNLDHQLEQMRFARSAGVTLAIGTDSGSLGVHHGESLIEEFKLFLEAGFSVEQTVACASKNGADLMGPAVSGELRDGRPASFIAVPGSPEMLPGSLKSIRVKYHHRPGALFWS